MISRLFKADTAIDISRVPQLLFNLLAIYVSATLLGWVCELHFWNDLGSFFAPIAPNIALILLISSASLIAYYRFNSSIVGFSAGLLFLSISVGLMMEFIFQESFGVNQILAENSFIASSAENELSPVTVMEIAFLGIALFSVVKCRGMRLLMLIPALSAVGIMALAGISIFAVLFEFTSTNDAGNFGSIPLTEGLAFFLLGLGILLQNGQDLMRMGISKKGYFPIYIGAILSVVTLASWLFVAQAQTDSAHNKIVEKANDYALATINLLAVQSKALRNLSEEYIDTARWHSIVQRRARELVGLADLKVIELNGTPSWNFTLKDNIQDSPKLLEARNALLTNVIASKRVLLSPVLPIKRGIYGFFVMAPILVNDKPTKILAALIKTDIFLSQLSPDNGFTLEMMQKQFAFSSFSATDTTAPNWHSIAQVPSIKVNWSVRLDPSVTTVQQYKGNIDTVILAFGLLITLIVSVLFHYQAVSWENARTAKINEQKYTALSNFMSAVVLDLDTKGNLLSASSSWETLSGVIVDQSLGQEWKRYIHPEDLASVEAAMREGLTKSEPINTSFRMISVTGALVPVNAAMQAIRVNDDPYGLLAALAT